MNLTIEQSNVVFATLRDAELNIEAETGLKLKLQIRPADTTALTPEGVLGIIAQSLGIEAKMFKSPSKKKRFAYMRFIGAVLLKKYIPKITHADIGELMGDRDSSTITNATKTSQELLDGGDQEYIMMFTKASNAVEIWLRS